MAKIEHSDLVRVLNYNATTGVFTWRITCGSRAIKGSEAGSVSSIGYRVIRVFGELYQAHRLAIFYSTKKWPAEEVDHINGSRLDNRLENIREATKLQNRQNRKMSTNNTSGVKGVSFHKANQRWQAQIGYMGQTRYLGYFNSKTDAAEAYESAARALFGEFKRAS